MISVDSTSSKNLKSDSVNYFVSKVRYQGTKVLSDATLFSSWFFPGRNMFTGLMSDPGFMSSKSQPGSQHRRLSNTHFKAT